MNPPLLFFSIFDNPSAFNFRGINTAKYFYDLWVTKSENADIDLSTLKNRNQHDFLKKPVLSITGFLKLIKILITSRHKVIFFGNENRLTKKEETYYDLYNYNIIHDIGKANVLVLQDRHDAINGKVYAPDLVIDDLTPLLFLFEKILKIRIRKDIYAFKRALEKKLAQIGFSKEAGISKLLKFYARYLFYKLFLRAIKPKSAVVICHYSKHAFVAACKYLHIPVIELMHGHILRSHRYYNIPDLNHNYLEKFHQYFLPDFMAVYGEYWKKNLIEGSLFNADQIINIGYYPKFDIQGLSPRSDDKVNILITSNPQVQKDFVEFIHSIETQIEKQNIRIIIKPHPVELDSAYTEIIDGNCIVIDRSSIYELFSKVDIHISVASTTLFDALLFDVDNYVLFVDRYQDICNEILDTQIAKRLDKGQLPDLNMKNKINKSYYMDTYNIHELKKIMPI